MSFSLPLAGTIWYNIVMNSQTSNNSISGDQMKNITSHTFISQNGACQVDINTDTKGRADIHYRYFRSSDGTEWDITKYPRRKSLEIIEETLKSLKEDSRYIDVSVFDEEELAEWRDIQRTSHERMWCSNRPTGSAWRAMGAGIAPKSFEDFWGSTPEEHYSHLGG